MRTPIATIAASQSNDGDEKKEINPECESSVLKLPILYDDKGANCARAGQFLRHVATESKRV
jgi:hypothetical protein